MVGNNETEIGPPIALSVPRATDHPGASCHGGEGVSTSALGPMVYFEAGSAFRLLDIPDLWKHREMLWMLSLRDLKVRYRQTIIGIAWAVLQPLTTMTIFWILFSLLRREPTLGELPYPLVVLSGLLVWQLFSSILTQSTASLVNNQNLIGKVYFPRLILPLATVLPALVDFAVSFLALCCLMAYYHISIWWPLLFVPFFVILAIVSALALGIGLSALYAMYRDFVFVVPFVVQVGFYVSPIVYATDALIPLRWQMIYALNPLVGVSEGFRWALLGGADASLHPQWIGLALSLALSLPALCICLVGSLMYFRRVDRFLADRI